MKILLSFTLRFTLLFWLQTYRQLLNKSKLKIDTGLGIATGNIHHSLSPLSCGDPLNIFLIPDIDPEGSYLETSIQYIIFNTLIWL